MVSARQVLESRVNPTFTAYVLAARSAELVPAHWGADRGLTRAGRFGRGAGVLLFPAIS